MNVKKLRRLYREERLQVRKRGGRKRALGTRRLMAVPQATNERWSLDFISDAFTVGRRFRVLAVVDDCTRECETLVADTSLSGTRVVRELDAVIARRGCQGTIVSDRAIVRQWFKGNGEKDRVHRDRGPVLVPARGGRLALHRAGEANSKWVHRTLQRALPSRFSERGAVLDTDRRPRGRGPPDPHLQYRAASFRPRIPGAGGLCRPTHRNGKSASRT